MSTQSAETTKKEKKAKTPIKAKAKTKAKKVSPTANENSRVIKHFLDTKTKWVDRVIAKEGESNDPADKLQMSLNQFLVREMKHTQDYTWDAYNALLASTSSDDRHQAITKIITNRINVLLATKGEDDDVADEITEDDLKNDKVKLGFLGERFEELCAAYPKTPTDELQQRFVEVISRMTAVRRMRFFYDLQQLRIQSSLRNKSYLRRFGLEDPYIEDTCTVLESLEKQQLDTIDRTMRNSPYGKIYSWITDSHVGCGPLMAGGIVAELVDPTRFRSIAACWAYAGLKVVDADPETGMGGRAQRRAKGETSNWNQQLKTKLLGVLAGCFVKAQTKYVGVAGEESKCRQVKDLLDYKRRITTQNELVPEAERVYSVEKKEIFHYYSPTPIVAFTGAGKRVEIAPEDISRRSKAHINKMANRYMMKMFLRDVLNKWREFEGLERLPDYNELYLRGGRAHGENFAPAQHGVPKGRGA